MASSGEWKSWHFWAAAAGRRRWLTIPLAVDDQPTAHRRQICRRRRRLSAIYKHNRAPTRRLRGPLPELSLLVRSVFSHSTLNCNNCTGRRLGLRDDGIERQCLRRGRTVGSDVRGLWHAVNTTRLKSLTLHWRLFDLIDLSSLKTNERRCLSLYLNDFYFILYYFILFNERILAAAEWTLRCTRNTFYHSFYWINFKLLIHFNFNSYREFAWNIYSLWKV